MQADWFCAKTQVICDARVDFNVVMTGSGNFVELQGTSEEATFSQQELDGLIKH